MLHRLYALLLSLASGPRAGLWLAIVAVAESSVFPIPPDALLLPMVLARPDRAWRCAFIATIGSVTGGLFGYAIGALVFDALARPLLHAYGYDDALSAFLDLYARWGVWIILIKGLTPIPYKIVTIASGAAGFPLLPFVFASIATRGARFFLEAALLRRYGDRARLLLERRLGWITAGVLLAVTGGLLAVRAL